MKRSWIILLLAALVVAGGYGALNYQVLAQEFGDDEFDQELEDQVDIEIDDVTDIDDADEEESEDAEEAPASGGQEEAPRHQK